METATLNWKAGMGGVELAQVAGVARLLEHGLGPVENTAIQPMTEGTQSPWNGLAMERHRLTDEQWSRMADLFGRPKSIGRSPHFEVTAGQTHEAAAFDAQGYRRRNIVERLISWLNARRRVFSRSEKTARHDAGLIRLAVIQRYLRTA